MTSLTLKPHLLRADTIDLQSHENPSAKDHTRGSYHSPYSHAGSSNAGPHHTQALRNANEDAYHERQLSPRMGGFDHSHAAQQDHSNMYDEGDEEDDDHPHNGMNGVSHGENDEDDDGDGNDSQDEDMDDDMLDKISSSPSIEDEDIDFEFVYALHTFVATVEGQANATKGDTMVLLDDSNSYWWLVRVVKDNSIGYLPAEHIETPTERLARLNKHRNIDLAAAMLGDNPEKSKNPLKKAMRRRNAKTVNFAPPTYYEPEDRDWSDEEEGNEDEEGQAMHVENGTAEEERNTAQQTQQAQQAQQAQQTQQIRPNNQVDEAPRANSVSASIHRVESDDEMDDDNEEAASPVKSHPQAAGSVQTNVTENEQQAKKVRVRNTDSFFKDDTMETRKISLTPQLLRGDGSSVNSTEQEAKPRTSLDTFDRIVGEDKSKDNKKKEKKGMLSGLFKRKDKSGKAAKHDVDDGDRASEDSGRSPAYKESVESELNGDRKPGKLQKTPPTVISPKTSPTETRSQQRDLAPAMSQQQGPNAFQSQQSEAAQTQQSSQHLSPESIGPQPSRFPSLQEKRSVFAPITDALRSKTSHQDVDDSTVKPIYSKRAKERFAIDDSDSDDGSTPTAPSSLLHRSISPLENNDSGRGRPDSDTGVSPIQPYASLNARPPLAEPKVAEKTNVNQQTLADAVPTSPSDQTASTSKQSPSIPTHTPSTSRSTPTWSDASLRSYMDNDQDIRDLLIIVHDKTNVTPVGPDHPLMNGLFASERTKLADMQSRLDSMLITWLDKKNPRVAAKT